MPPKRVRKVPESDFPSSTTKALAHCGIEELLLPRTVIAKVAKAALPEGMQLPRDGVTALMRSATMFTSYVTAEANTFCKADNRKTVNHTDIIKALEVCGFPGLTASMLELVEKSISQRAAAVESRKPDLSLAENETEIRSGDEGTEDEDDFIQEDAEPEENDKLVTRDDTKRMRTDDSAMELDE